MDGTSAPADETAAATAADMAQYHIWNDDFGPTDGDARVHDLIAARMAAAPAAPSVCAWDGGWTYAELDGLSSALASRLRARGVRVEDLVPVLVPKSRWTAVALLAVVRSGAAFVLLDDAHPPARLRALCAELRAPVILAAEDRQVEAAQLLAAEDGAARVLPVGTASLPPGCIAEDNQSWRAAPVTGTSALYAVFTSGSTGRPKGAVVEHASLCAAAVASGRVLGMSAQTRAFQFASFAFDPTIMDFLRTWIHGACVCIPSPEQARNDVAGAFTALRANQASLTPSVARLLDADALPGLRVLEFAGEPMLPSDVEKWADRVVLVNAYGNAECSVYSVMRSPVRRGMEPGNIGFPVACVAWIVDETDASILLPLGQVGELVLEGPGIGRGYLGHPEMTADSFIRDPPWLREFREAIPGGTRLYKTGDLAQYQPDGSLLCLGRKDTQTKVRGQRIELSEVELHIRDQLRPDDEVVAEVVRLDDRREGRAALVAFVRLHDVTPPKGDPHGQMQLFAPPSDSFRVEMEEVERGLQSRVPTYMVPGAFVALNRVPLSLSGKTDRRRLREEVSRKSWVDIEAYMLKKTAAPLSPATELERQLRNAFACVLGIDANDLGLHDSFFRRGGDSILAMQLSAHCRGLGMHVTTQDIFQRPTVSSLKDTIGTQGGQPFPLSPSQRMLIAHQERLGDRNHPDSRFYTFRVTLVPGSLDLGGLQATLQTLLHRHPALRTTFTTGGDGQWAQVVREPLPDFFQCIPVHVLAPQKDDPLSKWDPHHERLNLHNGPLLLAHLVNLEGSGLQYLYLVAPKVSIDSRSWDIILQELSGHLESRGGPNHAAAGSFQSWLAKTTQSTMVAETTKELLPSHFGFENKQIFPSPENIMRPLVEFQLDSQTASLLWSEGTDNLRADPKEMFLGILIHSFQSVFPDQKNLLVLIEHDGRTRDVAHEVGQFTTFTQLILSSRAHTGLFDAVDHAKDTFRAAVKAHDIDYPRDAEVIVVIHWSTKKTCSDPAGDAASEMHHQLFHPPQSLDEGELSALRRQPGTLDITVAYTPNSLHVQVLDFQSALPKDGTCEWFGVCQTTLAELPRRCNEAAIPPRVSDFLQLDMSQENFVLLIDDIIAQNHGVSTRSIEEIYPVSFIQQGMLLSQARDPRTYRSCTSWAVSSRDRSSVDLDRLQEAWETTARGHSILRTVFVQGRDGSYYQVVLKGPRLPITTRGPGGEASTATAIGWHEDGQPELPWKLLLVDAGDGQTVTCELHISHALMDGDSMRVLVRDAGRAYKGRCAAQKPPQYCEYIEYLRQSPQDGALDYWKTCLQDAEPCLFPSSEGIQQEAAIELFHDIEVAMEGSPRLHTFCETEGVTLFNVVQLAWAIVLQCYTGNDAVVFGYLTSGRDVPIDGAEDIVGPLINMLISRVDLDRGVSVRSGLEQCRDRFTESLPHQHCALADIYRALGQSGAGLFNTVITYQKELAVDDDASIAFEQIRDQQPTEFDIVVNVTAASDAVAVSLTYVTEKLTRNIAESLGRTFSTVISEIISRPDAGVGELNLLSPADWTRVLAWNSPPATAVQEPIQEPIRNMCLKSPERPAVDAWDGRLTYRQLWDHALHLAGMLQRHGVEAETPVPVCLEKSVWVPVCMLAILLTGGVCVPMDPDAHIERLRAIIEETSPSIILVSPTSALLGFCAASRRIVISSDLFVASEHSDEEAPLVQVRPETAAFLLFTSGSTGRPKGIVLQHGSISTTLRDQGRNLLLHSDSRVLHFASYTFDVSVYEVLATLTAGGCVCIPSEAARANDLAAFIRERQVNWVISTPSLFRLFQPADVPSVRTVSLAGEAIPQDLVDLWAGRVQLFNAYGPAECTICTTHRIEAQGWIPGTIGRAAGGQAWVTDRSNSNRLLPIGAAGELLFQGPVVAREYFRRPEATEKAFLTARPLWLSAPMAETGGRLYRTGDLVQYNPDGSLRYLGRKDTQVKLRGQRIELEGIESQIRAHLPADYRVVVDAVSPADQASTKLLVAFIQQGPRADQDESELLAADEGFRALALEVQTKLDASMPNYMVPQLLIPVTWIPVSKTGKTNRRVLREAATELSRSDLETLVNGGGDEKPQPTTPAEEAMQRLWAAVLNRPARSLGIRDNFFQIGGDSITAMKLVRLVRSQGQALAVSDVFQWPTLAELAAGLQSAASLSKAQLYLPCSSVTPDDEPVRTPWATTLASSDRERAFAA